MIVEHGQLLADYAGIFCVLRHQTVLVSAPRALVGTVSGWCPSIDTVMDPQWWSDRLPDWLVLGPSVHSFLDRPAFLPAASGGIAVRAARRDDLDRLIDQVTHAEWEESGFADDDDAHAWVALDQHGRPMAAAKLTVFDGVPADVGVLAAGIGRGRGFATAVAATAARHAVAHHGIARWRALATNAPSRRIAEKLGFEDDCLQLAIRPA
ncbi:GNAT family N-acetyltransferase [Terrabacter sp. GCM10028922]|uniref:GNAT family N-acetyltransferase n=1 Tax=Terrabacter sp. GCM10028922 TaxID=3273428 RepID=UPI00360D4579